MVVNKDLHEMSDEELIAEGEKCIKDVEEMLRWW